ncbi:MAG: DUF3105 domain-containing protein [Propionibacteriales bacterium]|nr:DUF3105 domain-containing protein [Propionibacteriales bacterium]
MTEQTPPALPDLVPLPDRGPSNRLVLVVLAVVLIGGLVAAGILIATDAGNEDPRSTRLVGGCGSVISRPVAGQARHAEPPGKVVYPDAPPASGDHWPAPATFGRPFYGADRPAVEVLVHNLEHGYTIAWYDETAAADADAMAALERIAADYQAAGERFIAAPWFASDGAPFPDDAHIALTRWSADPEDTAAVSSQRGNWLYCGAVDPDAITSFFTTWPNAASAEPGLY